MWSRRNSAKASSFRPTKDWPSIVTRPRVAGSRPAITIKSEVFPEPEGPTTPTVWPASMVRSMPRRISTAPELDANESQTSLSSIALGRILLLTLVNGIP